MIRVLVLYDSLDGNTGKMAIAAMEARAVYDAPTIEAMLKFSMEPEVMAWMGYNTTETKPVMTLEEAMKLLK